MLRIFVDADACPVKSEIYRVAERYSLRVTLVANSRMRIPDESWIELVVVGAGLDVADDWIVTAVEADDIVVSGDVLLAARCLQKGAHVIGVNGRPFLDDNIGSLVAMRELHSQLREEGMITGGLRRCRSAIGRAFWRHSTQRSSVFDGSPPSADDKAPALFEQLMKIRHFNRALWSRGPSL